MADRLKQSLTSLTPQPLIGWIMLSLAGGSLAWMVTGAGWSAFLPIQFQAVPVVVVLALAMVLAFRHPIHFRQSSEVVMTTVPKYLLAVLLPPGAAFLVVGLAVFAGEMSTRKKRGLYLSDITTQTGRVALAVLPASLLAHLSGDHSMPATIWLLAVAGVFWSFDMFTSPLLLGPICREPARAIISASIKGAGVSEATQYLLGIMGAMLVRSDQPYAISFLIVPAVLVYLGYEQAHGVRFGMQHIVQTMADTVDQRDQYTGGHSRRVARYSRMALREMGVFGSQADLIVSAARVHDIGKIVVPEHVLNKEGALNDEEWELMRNHAVRGAELLSRYPDFAHGVSIVRHHHERVDGRGYPDAIAGDAIPFGSKIIAVADSYDAMTTSRPYRSAMSSAQATSILESGRGSQWEPAVVDGFIRALRKEEARSAAAGLAEGELQVLQGCAEPRSCPVPRVVDTAAAA